MIDYLLAVLKSPLYWGVLLFAIVPMLIEAAHLNVVYGMLIYFSLFWYFIFRILVRISGARRSVIVDFCAYIFTAAVGTWFAFHVESLWVALGAGSLLQSPFLNIRIPTFTLVVGITEEVAKQIVIIIILIIVRKRQLRVQLVEFMIAGIASGLGFSAIENISYVQSGIMNDVVHHVVGAGVITALSRALYTPFLHGIFSGIAAYGIGITAYRGMTYWWQALLLIGLSTIAHGFYDATVDIHILWGLLDVAVTYFVFFLLLLNGLRLAREV